MLHACVFIEAAGERARRLNACEVHIATRGKCVVTLARRNVLARMKIIIYKDTTRGLYLLREIERERAERR